MYKKFIFLIFPLFFAILISGCTLPWQKKEVESPIIVVPAAEPIAEANQNSGQMKKFSDYGKLKDFLQNNAIAKPERVSGAQLAWPVKTVFDDADIIKTDGQYIYAVIYSDLYIIKAAPLNQARLLAKIPFNSRPSALYLDKGRLVVIGADTQIMESKVYQNFRRQSAYTFVKIFDLTDPEAPKQIRNLDFEGSYLNSRLIGGRLHLILNNYNAYVPGEPLAPRLVDDGKVLSSNCADNARCFAPDMYYFDVAYDTYNFTSINTINLHDKEAAVSAQTYLLNAAHRVHFGLDNVYISYAQPIDGNSLRLAAAKEILTARLSEATKNLAAKIETAEVGVLSREEREQKVLAILQNFLITLAPDDAANLIASLNESLKQKYTEALKNTEKTTIYKLSLSGDKPSYKASAFVSGVLPGQFALSEDDGGNLRVITERPAQINFSKDTENSDFGFYFLSPDLKVAGALEKINLSSKIKDVRFLGKRAYLSLLKSDNLSVIGFDNLQSIQLLGELKIANNLKDLYFYNDQTLIGIGRENQTDVYNNIKTKGLKLSLVDVGNIASPRELDYYVTGFIGSDSLAFYDDRALSINRGANLLVLPAALTSSSNVLRPYFGGALLFSLDGGKFNLKTQADHSDGGKYQHLDDEGECRYVNSVRRVFYTQDAIYTFSNKYLKIHSLNDFSTITAIKLVPDSETDVSLASLLPPEADDENNAGDLSALGSLDYVAPVGPLLPSSIDQGAEALPVNLETPVSAPEIPVETASTTNIINP